MKPACSEYGFCERSSFQIAYFEITVLDLSASCNLNFVSGDNARVVLRSKTLGNNSDYINASFINVS